MAKKPLVVITGASSGIGAATAHRFGKEGYRLVLLARRMDKLELLQKQIKSPTSIFSLDVVSAPMVFKIMKKIEKEEGPIDILVNNAGLAIGLERAHEAKMEDWDRCIDVNIKGLLHCTQAVLPSMVKRDKGHIINLGSIAGTYPYPGGNVYGSTKAFVHQFSLNLKADLLGTQVRVSCIEPGLVGGTEFSDVRFRGDKKRAESVYEGANALLPEDIAETIFFCTAISARANINTIEIMPVTQASTSLAIHRTKK